ncbi:MAG: ribonuclease J [Methanomassiliicoccales archaeon]|nr:MAG: ribonuclease J [Methanomassiliicoccales archaeon]
MFEINVLKGSSSIGGNKILLSFEGRNVLFDFGYDYSVDKQYFDTFTKARQNRGIHDHLALDMLPRLSIYRSDIITKDCSETCASFPKVDLDALFVSHAHMDHMGMAGYLDAKVPFIGTPMTLVLMKAIEDTSEMIGTEVAYYGERSHDGDFLLKSKGSNIDYIGRPLISTSSSDGLDDFLDLSPTKRKIRRDKCGNLDDLDFGAKCFMVDHSIYGAAAFGVDTGDGWVVYTGDLRDHGMNGERTTQFAKEASKIHPKVLIIEGTRTSRDEELEDVTENDVERRCLEECTDVDGLIVADFGPRNFERLETFKRIAEKVGRELVITPKDAYFLDAMRSADGTERLDDLRVLVPNKDLQHSTELRMLGNIDASKISPLDIKRDPDGHILCFSFYDLPHLLDIRPDRGLYIYSGSGSFDEEQDHDFERLDNWIRLLGMRKVGFEMGEREGRRGKRVKEPLFTPGFHASGHASKAALKKMIDTIRPEYLLPVHTENGSFFREEISSVPRENIILPKDGHPIVFS